MGTITFLRLIKKIGMSADDIGSSRFIARVKDYFSNGDQIANLVNELNVGKSTLEFIVEALQQTCDYDLRAGELCSC